MKKIVRMLYCVLFFILCIFPFAGMTVAENTATVENTELAAFPSLKVEGEWNQDLFSQWGEWFEDHFAFRQEMLTANSRIRGDVFQVSGAVSVIQGTGGWLYYQATVNDYLAMDTLTDRELYNIAHNLALIQEYAESQGCEFLFTVAPNKNTLYGEQMPYYYQMKTGQESNLTRLVPYLEQEQVAYADLVKLFKQQDEILYHARDSHWNNKGAALVQDTLLTALGKRHKDYLRMEPEVRVDHIGDLDTMVYPLATEPEIEYYYEDAFTYYLEGEESAVTDATVQTYNPKGSGRLLMYRDSFGNTLLPFMANAYKNGYFSQLSPYPLSDIQNSNADTVVIEKVERHLSVLGARPAVMAGPARELDVSRLSTAKEVSASFEAEKEGDFWKITGVIFPSVAKEDSRVYIRVGENQSYECFTVTTTLEEKIYDYGYQIYLTQQEIPDPSAKIEVIVEDKEGLQIVYTAEDGL